MAGKIVSISTLVNYPWMQKLKHNLLAGDDTGLQASSFYFKWLKYPFG